MSGSPSKSRTPQPSGRRSSVTRSSPVRETPLRQESETETSSISISEGIPPKSIKHMRDNLRNIIDSMGDEENSSSDCPDQRATAPKSEYCNNAGGGSEVQRMPSYTECHCCGKQTSSESSIDCCKCNKVLPEVHKSTRSYVECVDMPQISSEDTIVAKCRYEKPPCVDRNAGRHDTIVAKCRYKKPPFIDRNAGRNIAGHHNRNERGYSAVNERQYRGYNEAMSHSLHPPEYASSSEECPCEGPCPGKHNTRMKLRNFIHRVVGIRDNIHTQQELYKFRLKEQDPNFKLPRRLVFDLVDGIPVAPPPVVEKEKPKEKTHDMEEVPENKVDIYYFDHGNSGYYRTTDHPPPLMADFFIHQTDMYATRFWAEIFGTIHIGLAFVTTFVLQFVRFFLYSILRPLTIGVIQLTSDYFFKPLLSILFNGVIQPILILMYNIATSFRDLCQPIAQGVGCFLREIADVFRSVRLVEINKFKTANCSRV